MPDIIINNLSVAYPARKKKSGVKVLNDLSVTFPNAQLSVLIGPSGCGKTTLLRCISGLQDYKGEAFFGDEEVSEMDMKKQNIAFVSQQFTLYPYLTIFDNIAFPLISAKLKGKEIIDRVYEIADQLDLTACLTRKPGQISGGQQQRTAIARALIKKPEICLFDEPLSNLDAQARKEQRRYIKNAVSRTGCTTVYVTHDLKEAVEIADFLVVMDEGKIIFAGKPEEALATNNQMIRDFFSEFERSDYV